jgi:hypothetical protein
VSVVKVRAAPFPQYLSAAVKDGKIRIAPHNAAAHAPQEKRVRSNYGNQEKAANRFVGF